MAQAGEVASPQPLGQSGPFLRSAAAGQQAATALSAVVEAATPAGLSTSAARMLSESVRARLWTATTPAPARTVVVQEGQSLWAIASAWGISVETIAAASGLTDLKLVRPGQMLLIPAAADPDAEAKLSAQAAKYAAAQASRPSARVISPKVPAKTPRAQARTAGARPLSVTVGEGQTLWSLARAHGTSVEAIVEANGLQDADRVRAGRRLVIPGRVAIVQPSPVAAAGIRARAGAAVTATAATTLRIARSFIWPARGHLTSRFGWRRRRHHDGVDIAAPYGSPIYASGPGRVAFVGWYYAYGRTVIIDHGDGMQSLYGHLSKLLVRTGETVDRGQVIGRVGTSGRSTGPHVHFEVRVNGRAVNPLRHMD